MDSIGIAPFISKIWKYNNFYGNLKQLCKKCWVSGSAELSLVFWRLPSSLAMEKVRVDSIVFSGMAEDGLFSNVNISKNLGGSLPLQSLGKQATEEVLGGNSRAAILRVRCGRKRQLILATGHLPFVYGSFPL